MKRREFIAALGAASVWTFAAHAQQAAERVHRIEWVVSVARADPSTQAQIEALRQGLKKLGWIEGRNLKIGLRWTESDIGRIRSEIRAAVELKPDLILMEGILGPSMAREATREIPIVFIFGSDPVANGLIASLAKPGGNITGMTSFEYAMAGKWLALLKELAPRISKVALIQFADAPTLPGWVRAANEAASPLGVELKTLGVRNDGEIEKALGAIADDLSFGILALPSPFIGIHRDLIIRLAAQRRLPAIYPFRADVEKGGLISYGLDPVDYAFRAATYIDRIFRGASPSDLPVQAPTKFELILNLKTAKALALPVPPSLLARADEVIE